jgi:serine phosphatase RsbU (regulator of sigma subunit)
MQQKHSPIVKTSRSMNFSKIKQISIFRRIGSGLLFLLPLVMIFSATLFWGDIFIPFSGSSSQLTKNDIRYFEDSTAKLSIDDILKQSDHFSKLPNDSDNPNFGFSASNFWMQFTLDSKKMPFGSNILQVNNPLLNEVELYELTAQGPVLLAITGDAHLFSSRPIEHRTFRFPLLLENEKASTFLLKVNGAGEQLMVPLSVWSRDSLVESDYQDNLLRGSYFGLIIFVLLFTVFLYLRLKEKSSLYYVHYNLNLLLLQFLLSGYAFQFLWPSSPYLANVATPFFASLSILALLKFAQYFLQLSEFYPKINRIFSWVGYVVMCNALLALIWTKLTFQVSVLTINIVALLLNFAIIPVAIAVLRKNFKPAKFFLIGFITLVITVFGFIATNLGIIRSAFYADYGLLIGSAAEVILLSFAVVDRFRSFKEQALDSLKELNKLEREQNEILEKTVAERTEEIIQQKTVLENQKEEILSSIRYAERIQKNLLPSEQEMAQQFPESFVIYKPKDIVSGDFYWIGKTSLNGVQGPAHEVLLLAAGDCTGHGVPGAMVSVMGCNLLRETLQQHPEAAPHEMLNEIDIRLKKTMSTHDGMYSGDGMDIVLCAIQQDTLELRVAGANNDVMVWDGENFVLLKGTSRAIGARHDWQLADFTTTTYQLKKGDIVYAYTDGIADQFGGEKNKKLKITGLKSLLSRVVNLNMKEQSIRIHEFFEEWKGDNEQIDDVCVIAVKI